ncbi:MAG TPA: hypothetical protein VG097_00210 [Gemmata sp.]|nr:hypothetical protein [Gemmata sp.]
MGTLLVCIVSHASLLAGDDDGKKEEEARREQQLKNMKRSAAQYAISTADDRKRLFKFHENAAMRWNNPAGAAKDGAVFIWSDRGRPQAIMKLYTFDNERFFHEWQSLSESAIFLERDGKTVWNPTEPGIKFRELPDAPKVAESAAERLRQMKALAGKFSSIYTQIPGESKPDELRLLIQPLFRFEASDDKQHLDGVIFGFARATDPIGLLIFEARRSGETYKWNYAFARMATGALTAKYGDKEIFSVDSYYANRGPKQTFLILNRQPIPKE